MIVFTLQCPLLMGDDVKDHAHRGTRGIFIDCRKRHEPTPSPQCAGVLRRLHSGDGTIAKGCFECGGSGWERHDNFLEDTQWFILENTYVGVSEGLV